MSMITVPKEEIARMDDLIKKQDATIRQMMASSTMMYGAHLFDVMVMYQMHVRLCQVTGAATPIMAGLTDKEQKECSDRALAELKTLLPKVEEAAAAFKKFCDENPEFSAIFSKEAKKNEVTV
jgi:hypothetical protein